MKTLLLLVLTVLMVSACSKPIPTDRLSYAGEWESSQMYLLILPDGTVAYERIESGRSTSINAPLQEFIGDDFVVGLGFMTTTFNVSQAPHQIDGKWTMVVDGVTLTRDIE